MTRGERPRRFPALCAAVVVGVVLVVAWPSLGGTSGSPTTARAIAALASSVLSPGGPAAPFAPSAPIDCSGLAARAQLLRAGGMTPPAVAGDLLAPCALTPDEASLTFLSNGSGAGSRVSLPIVLPGTNRAFGPAFASFSVRMWVTGVPCSFEGLTDLAVTFFPPWSPLTRVPSANWTVWAPAWDLVPAGSCDPACQNASATVSVLSARFCEDDVVVGPIGGRYGPSVAAGRPGDALTVTLAGSPQGPGALSLYLNDSTNPSSSLAVTFGGTATFDGRSLRPAFNASTPSETGWGDHGAIALGLETCPSTYGVNASTVCDSYSASTLAAVAGPIVGAPTYYVPAFRAYTGDFSAVATASSSGACRSGPAACADARSFGGDGAYPLFSIDAARGSASFAVGGVVGPGDPFGEAAVQFPNGSGTLRPLNPAVLGPVAATAQATSLGVTLRVSDPVGVSSVEAAGLYCTGSATPGVSAAAASLSPGAENTSRDGNWSASLPLPGYSGTFPIWVRATSAAGTVSAAAETNVTVSGGSGSCPISAPGAPTVPSAGVVSLARGYRVNVSDASPALTGYGVVASPIAGGAPVDLHFGNATVLVLTGLAAGVAYNLSVTALNAANLSSVATVVTASATLPALTVNLTASPTGPVWVGAGPVTFAADAGGGAAPYSFRIDFGDGNGTVSNGTGLSFSAAHAFGAYFGAARAVATVTDALGEVAVSSPFLLPVWATPLGVPAVAAAGDSAVNISWSPPASPAGSVVRYTVFFTEDNASDGVLTAVGPFNDSALGLTAWNTTGLSLYLPVPNGVRLWADVVAWDAAGEGLLPATGTPRTATPAPLVLGAIAAVAGGPAPFNDSFRATATAGSNDSVLSAIYSFPGFVLVPAQVTILNGTIYLNASYTFPGPGTFVVVLHLFDAFYSTQIQTTTVYVSAGASPSVSVLILNAPSYARSPVAFEASASGGSGKYTYAWAFGDGLTGAGPFPTHTYASAGAYTAVLTVTDNGTGGVNVTDVAVEVFQDPTVLISVYPGANGSGSFVFTASAFGGSGPSTFLWSFGDGSVARGAEVPHDFAAPGQYSVGVTATDPAGRSGNSTYVLTVSPGPSTGTGGSGPLGPLAVALLAGLAVAVALLVVAVVYLAGRLRGRPPADGEPEDGEVSLT